jgi:hypothetical protein
VKRKKQSISLERVHRSMIALRIDSSLRERHADSELKHASICVRVRKAPKPKGVGEGYI